MIEFPPMSDILFIGLVITSVIFGVEQVRLHRRQVRWRKETQRGD